LNRDGVKTKESGQKIFQNHTAEHVELGVKILGRATELLARHSKGSYKEADTE